MDFNVKHFFIVFFSFFLSLPLIWFFLVLAVVRRQVCSKIFGNASALAKHKLTHSDERKYVCGMCSKAFKRQDHL